MRHASVTAVVLVVCALAVPSVRAQAEPVEFKLAFAKGDTSFLLSTMTIEGNIQLMSTNVPLPQMSVRSRDATRVLDVESDGTFVIEIDVEDFQISIAGKTQESMVEPTTLRVSPNGKVVGLSDADVFPFAFPDRAVGVGDSWTHRSRIFLETGQQVDATQTFRVVAFESGTEGRLVRISVETAGAVSGGSVPQVPPGVRVTPPKGTARGLGEIVWAPERSRIIQRSDDLVVQVESDITAQGQTSKITTTIRLKERAEALSAEAAKLPIPPAEQLIVPGKSLGPYAIDALVADLTARLGRPDDPRTMPPLLAQRISWANGLTGYLDPADPAKLIGLSIADKAFLTDKGVGFGSSEGAVLLAYGAPTARIDVRQPVGAVRILVYNDAGVAFAISADKDHVAMPGRHAPMGRVDWVDVFAPGTRAKIYPLP